jgi:hypothetical protein
MGGWLAIRFSINTVVMMQKCVMEDLENLKVKNCKETAKDRRTWRELAEKAETHKGL